MDLIHPLTIAFRMFFKAILFSGSPANSDNFFSGPFINKKA